MKVGSASRREKDPVPTGMGNERYEQPMDSDRNAKLQRRKAREGVGTVLCTDRFRVRDLAKRGESQGGRGRCANGRTIRHVYINNLRMNP